MSTPTDNRIAELRISGDVARTIIVNSYALLRHKFRGSPLWSWPFWRTELDSACSDNFYARILVVAIEPWSPSSKKLVAILIALATSVASPKADIF